MKLGYVLFNLSGAVVTPFVGVWIETSVPALIVTGHIVTPFVGVWIET